MWGNLSLQPGVSAGRRSIPSYVGELYGLTFETVVNQEHPLVCGGTAEAILLPHVPSGTSPRMWENLHRDEATEVVVGIIPSYVGEPVLLQGRY